MKKKRIRKNDLVKQMAQKLRMKVKKLFLVAREWVNATYGRRIKYGEAIAAFHAHKNKKHIHAWVWPFLNQKDLIPA